MFFPVLNGLPLGKVLIRTVKEFIDDEMSTYASALAYLRKPIPALSDEQARYLGREVAVIDYAPAGTSFLARNVKKKIAGPDNAFILANHGIVALGTDVETRGSRQVGSILIDRMTVAGD